MNWKTLLTPEIRDFIQAHEDKDVSALGLKKPPKPDWPYPLILNQIKARQKAKKKIPSWVFQHPNIVLPAPDIIEQASSAATALYKAQLVKGGTFVDLCAGAGVDSWAFSNSYKNGVLVDKNPENAALLAHNFNLLTKTAIDVKCAAAEDILDDFDATDLIYIDPQRRDDRKKGKFQFEDCTPDILDLLPKLKGKTPYVMVKASPMIDIDYGLETLQHVHSVHVLEWQGECKEVVFVLHLNEPSLDFDTVPIHAVRLDDQGNALKKLEFQRCNEKNVLPNFTLPSRYLYEPSPAFLKAGGFSVLASHYNLSKLHPHTHLYTSDFLVSDFPGRVFEIEDAYPAHQKSLPFRKANLTLRNFPGTVETLRKQLKLKEGGDVYLFACTFMDHKRGLIACRKVNIK